jgi:hypothetical protein
MSNSGLSESYRCVNFYCRVAIPLAWIAALIILGMSGYSLWKYYSFLSNPMFNELKDAAPLFAQKSLGWALVLQFLISLLSATATVFFAYLSVEVLRGIQRIDGRTKALDIAEHK